MNEGFIKLNRKMLDWEWYDDINTKTLFIHCLLRANFKDQEWHGKIIKRGSFVSSYAHLAKETCLSIQTVRTSISKLKSTGELTVKTSNKYSVFIVNNYCFYQDVNKQTNKQSTNNQHATNKQLTTIEERKERKNEKKLYIRDSNPSLPSWYGEIPTEPASNESLAEAKELQKKLKGESQ